MSLCILLLYWIIDPEIFFVRFIPFNTCTNTLCKDLNRKNLICMNFLLPLSIFFFFVVFECHLIVLFPKELFGNNFTTKNKLNLVGRCVRLSKFCNFMIYFCVIKYLITAPYKKLIYIKVKIKVKT